jgi:hypothetical protein
LNVPEDKDPLMLKTLAVKDRKAAATLSRFVPRRVLVLLIEQDVR